MLHIPILRAGRPYRSLDGVELQHVKTGEPVARMSQANRGLISRDHLSIRERQLALDALPVAELLRICKEAARLFAEGTLPVDPDEGVDQTPEDYVRTLSSTTGMPETLGRANMEKVRFVMDEMEMVLGGLTRGLDLQVLDVGWKNQDGRAVSYLRQADSLGVVLPSNSPGVHSLWLPAIPLKVPLVLKPGSREPWTPLRVCHAFIQAGLPPQALGFYPADYGGANEIMMRCDRSMIFGDESTVRAWRGDSRIQLHGPGWSKVLLGHDVAGDWSQYLDVIETSIALNGGRSCLNASGVWTTADGRALAEALAQRFVAIEARPLDAPDAALAAFSDPRVAHKISEYIDRQLQIPGAEDLTAALRQTPRVAQVDGCTFLLPTVVWCADPEHPLAQAEFLFPFASVVQAPQDEMLGRIGSTLVGTAITEDKDLIRQLMAARNIDRLNIGALPTSKIFWDQPHEGNLFEHLYRQRAFQAQAG